MSQLHKLKQEFKACSGAYPYKDAKRLLLGLGFEETSTGGGSRRRFVHVVTKRIIRLHEPHPGNEIKAYAVRDIRDALELMGLL